MNENRTVATLADVLDLLDQAGISGTRRRDMVSAVKRICEMAATAPHSVTARGRPLDGDRLYDIVRARTIAKFGKAMSLHDFRRAAATFLAMDAPEKIGLIPGVLQHVSPDVSDQHYNLARSMQAGRRFAAHLANARNGLRPLSIKAGG
jgi:hypothetical protein